VAGTVTKRWAIAAAAALVAGTAPTFLRTFVNDDATYVLVAQKLNAGASLYRQAVDNKPPLMYATVAALFRLLGAASPAALKLMTLAAQLSCAGLVFAIGRRLFGARVGAIAALFFSLAAVSGLAEDFAAPNTEIFANLFVLAAIAALSRQPESPSRRALAAAGLLVGLASLYRLQAAAALLAVLLHLAWRPAPRRDRLVAIAVTVAGFVAPLGLCLAYFAGRGSAGELWLWAVRNNLSYVGVGEARVGRLALGRLGLVLLAQFPLLLVAHRVGSAWRSTREPHRARLRLVLLQLLAALLAYRTGSRFHGHYFVQALPFLALAGGWGFAHLPRDRHRWLRFVPHLLSPGAGGLRAGQQRAAVGASRRQRARAGGGLRARADPPDGPSAALVRAGRAGAGERPHLRHALLVQQLSDRPDLRNRLRPARHDARGHPSVRERRGLAPPGRGSGRGAAGGDRRRQRARFSDVPVSPAREPPQPVRASAPFWRTPGLSPRVAKLLRSHFDHRRAFREYWPRCDDPSDAGSSPKTRKAGGCKFVRVAPGTFIGRRKTSVRSSIDRG
jgi:Dolichyl-phosphate-mannose-protein mannosyltransferase